MKISVLVPVYREPKFAADIARTILANSYVEKEVILAIDGEMTPEIATALDPLQDTVTIFYPHKHLGKAKLLNEAVTSIETDILLFLDNDILLPTDPLFLEKLKVQMENYDIVEMAKEVIKESIYSAMISYEYIGFSLIHHIFSKVSNRLPSVIGSAFAVKKQMFDTLKGFRQVVHEDLDFGARAFRIGARYSFNLGLKVKTTMPNDLSDWIQQRKRWTLINLLWFKENIVHILASIIKYPNLLPTILLILSPALLSYSIFFLFNHSNVSYLGSLLLLVTQSHQYISGIFLWFTHYAMITKGIVSALLSFLVSLSVHYGFSIYARYRFHTLEYLIYYFFYMPLIVLMHIGIFILLLFERKIRLEWRVSEG